MSVLANLESSELVEAIQSTITIIAASWSDCIEKIASVSIDEKSSMHALTASFNILGKDKMFDFPFKTNVLNDYKCSKQIQETSLLRASRKKCQMM